MNEILQQIDWQGYVPMLAALLLGGAIGVERELSGKAAGLRTNILICVGAAMFTYLSTHLPGGGDRMLAGVITGVGFIGGGAVMRDPGGVHGITTAATIWLVTGIGIACGLHFYAVAVGVTILALVVLIGMHPVDKKIHETHEQHNHELQ